jgi:hypothetical protein
VEVVTHTDFQLPKNLLAELHEWLAEFPDVDDGRHTTRFAIWISETAQRIRSSDTVAELVGFAPRVSGHQILHDAGLTDASHEEQADAIRDWLDNNRAGPTLKYDLRRQGFGDLLGETHTPPTHVGHIDVTGPVGSTAVRCLYEVVDASGALEGAEYTPTRYSRADGDMLRIDIESRTEEAVRARAARNRRCAERRRVDLPVLRRSALSFTRQTPDTFRPRASGATAASGGEDKAVCLSTFC